MQRIFANQPRILTVCPDAPGNPALYCTVEAQGLDPRRGMTSDRRGQQDGTMGMPVLGVDRNEVWFGNVGIPMGEVGTGVVNVVWHPPKRGRVIQLDVAMLEGELSSSDFEAIAQQIGAEWFEWYQIRKGLPEAIGAAEVPFIVVRWQIKPQPPLRAFI